MHVRKNERKTMGIRNQNSHLTENKHVQKEREKIMFRQTSIYIFFVL